MSVLQELAASSSPFPTVDLEEPNLPSSGLHYDTPRFCAKVFGRGKCAEFYRQIAIASGRQQCPYGFSVWPVQVGDGRLAVTALIGHPRQGSDEERQRAKEHPQNKVAAEKVERWTSQMLVLVREGDAARNAEFSRRLEALHEIRKFNQIIKTNMERVCTKASPDDPDRAPVDLVRAFRASGLISVQLDALDLLANPESAKKFGARKTVFYRTVDKIVRIYQVLADTKRVKLRFNGSSMAWSLIDDRTIHIIRLCAIAGG